MSFWSEAEKAAMDYVVIDKTWQSPGVVRVSGEGIPKNWQVREGVGLSGATQTFRGLGLAEFDLEFEVWTPEHRAAWKVFRKGAGIEAPPLGAPEKKHQIDHPLLADIGITICTFLNVPLAKVEPGQADRTVYVVKCRDGRKPLPAPASPTAPGQSTVDGTAKSELEKRVEARVEALDKKFGELGL